MPLVEFECWPELMQDRIVCEHVIKIDGIININTDGVNWMVFPCCGGGGSLNTF